MRTDLKRLEEALRRAWGADTCFPGVRETWDPENPSLGQCTVTALVVQAHFGGDLFYNRKLHHYWNNLPGFEEVDFTRDQYLSGTQVKFDGTRQRADVLGSERAEQFRTMERYLILRDRVDEALAMA